MRPWCDLMPGTQDLPVGVCKKKIAMTEDWTSGMRLQRIPVVKHAKVLLVACPYCHEDEYRAIDKVSFCNSSAAN